MFLMFSFLGFRRSDLDKRSLVADRFLSLQRRLQLAGNPLFMKDATESE